MSRLDNWWWRGVLISIPLIIALNAYLRGQDFRPFLAGTIFIMAVSAGLQCVRTLARAIRFKLPSAVIVSLLLTLACGFAMVISFMYLVAQEPWPL